MELLDYERKHIEYCEANAHESVLLLKRNDAFPIDKPCKVALFGNGARNTIKGGTGSGDVVSRYFVNIETGLEQAGFTVTSKPWLDAYDEEVKKWLNSYIRRTIKEARKHKIWAAVYSMGVFDYEHDYEISTDYEGDIALYVLSRNSGEGNDRKNIKGDVKLSDSEVRDILDLNKRFSKFMLILNVGGVVDLTPVLEVSNILYLSQLGVVTGSILPKILLGEVNPSGKLATTWAKPEDYPFFDEFFKTHDTYYKEGIYVGYRYFDSMNKEPYFPFGYGLSYTDFSYEIINSSLEGRKVSIDVKVTNVGKMPGKEVIQAYLHSPKGKLDKEYQSLVGYKKTKLLDVNESEVVTVEFDISNSASYDEETASYILEEGNYYVLVGNSSRNTKPALCIKNNQTIITRKLNNKLGKADFKDFVCDSSLEVLEEVKTVELNQNAFVTEETSYAKDTYVDPAIEKLSNDELFDMAVGQYGKGMAAIVGESSVHAPGAAGETTLKVQTIDKYLIMADGPAGLRLKQTYGVDEKGIYDIAFDPMMVKMAYFLPARHLTKGVILPNNSKRKGEIHHQYTTAIPIGTALAQSFNNDYLYELGKIVSEEMETFNIDLWLAPAMNIHRNILCGRNFEYFSEDPFVSGVVAAYITKGVQSDPKRGVTIKHFAGNNQELNRNNNNDHVSERAFREIYLRGFEICVKESQPKAIMTSYNLINGVHASESYELLNDILRCEWGFDGLIMTDWIQSGRSFCYKHKYPAPYAANNVLAGNDLTMPGAPADVKNLKKALKQGKLTRQDLVYSASRIYRSIQKQKD
ncbi:MAG: glycoside hydrolase family 3 C-terminal domain-containing protein [Bacilli bacterium]|nr:glycoside hydrolase family 3 C-terminal domain-containing protein [Bacilli bacterium]